MPAPGTMVRLSPAFNPPVLKAIKVSPEEPFRFEFVVSKTDAPLAKEDSLDLIKYFLAAVTTPDKDLWVNLSPYEKDRIIPEGFGQTQMGRDLLAQDYLLKQITASLIYPEDAVGKKFWKRIYEEAGKKYGTSQVPVNTFNKVWIVPDKSVVYENAKTQTAYVVESSLKVMLESDYLSAQKHSEKTDDLGKRIVREVIIPQLNNEVNNGQNFARLRQVYNALILAAWYKQKIKDSILSRIYAGQNKTSGINIEDPQENQKIYEQYLLAFKKGAYNYIKEEKDPLTKQMIPRKYFSGGAFFGNLAMTSTADPAMVKDESGASVIGVNVAPDLAMKTRQVDLRLPRTPIEAVRQWQSFVSDSVVPDTPLHQQVPIRFWVTSQKQKWDNGRGEDGLYAKVMPPLKLADGRYLVPMLGDMHEVEGIDVDWQSAGIDPKLQELSAFNSPVSSAEFFGLLARLVKEGEVTVPDVSWENTTTEVEAIGITTLRSLMHILHEKNVPELKDLLNSKGMSFDQLINLPKKEFLDIVPDRLFILADDIRWNDYKAIGSALNQLPGAQHFWLLDFERNVKKEAIYDGGARFHQYFSGFYRKLPAGTGTPLDYLHMTFEPEQQIAGQRITLRSLQLAIKKLIDQDDKVLKFFMEHDSKLIHLSWADLQGLDQETLVNSVPVWVWYRALGILQRKAKEIGVLSKIKAVTEALVNADLSKVRVSVRLKKLDDGDMRSRGLEPVVDENAKPVILNGYTYKDVVGRLFFLYGQGSGYVVARSNDGKTALTIDGEGDFLKALQRGYRFEFNPGRMDFKALGTNSSNVYRFYKDGKSVVDIDGRYYLDGALGRSLSFDATQVLMSDKEGNYRPMTAVGIKENPGIFLDTNFQPGFPSPSGTEVEDFSRQQLAVEKTFESLGGASPYHTISRYPLASFGKNNGVNVYGTVRFNAPQSLRINEAFHEYGLSPTSSLLGKWKNSGVLKDRLEAFARGLGQTQGAVLLSGLTWILLGGKLLHVLSDEKVAPLSETYKFFINNVDLSGRQADLGDFLSLKGSLNDDDAAESIALIAVMAGQLLLDLKSKGIITDADLSDLGKRYMKALAEGYGVMISDKDVPNMVGLKQLQYRKEKYAQVYMGQKIYGEHYVRDPLPDDFESFIAKIAAYLKPKIQSRFPIVKTDLDTATDSSFFKRMGFEQPLAIPDDVVVRNAFTDIKRLSDAGKNKVQSDALRLAAALHAAFMVQDGKISWGGKELTIAEALQQLNTLTSSDAAMLVSGITFYDHAGYSDRTKDMVKRLGNRDRDNLLQLMKKGGFTALYIDLQVNINDLSRWIQSRFTDPRILVRRVDRNTLNIELSRTIVKDLNDEAVGLIKKHLDAARKANKPVVNAAAMEMPVVYQQGAHKGGKMHRAGVGGGGEGVFMNDLSAALNQNGAAYLVTAPLFLDDLEQAYSSHKYKTIDDKIDAYLADVNGHHLMDIELPLGMGTYPLTVLFYVQAGAPVLQLFDKSGHLFKRLYEIPNPDSAGGYIEAFLLPLAAVEISRQLGLQFDAFHFHDWQAALGSMILDTMYHDQQWPLGFTSGRVQTLHNFEPQGIFKPYSPLDNELYLYLRLHHVVSQLAPPHLANLFAITGLDAYAGDGQGSLRDRYYDGLEFYGNHVPGQHRLIAALKRANASLSVSKGHLKEGLANRSYGLSPVFQYLNEQQKELGYVYNGIFAPNQVPERLKALNDEHAHKLGFRGPGKPLSQLSNEEKALWKHDNKKALQKRLQQINPSFDANPNNTVIGISTRIVKQKGLNILYQKVAVNGVVKTLLEHLLDGDGQGTSKIQLAFLGTPGANDKYGEDLVKFLEVFLVQHPQYVDRFAFVKSFDPVLAKQIGAGADLFLMPSIDEPGGIANLELALLLAFGIVTNRGGLNDFKENDGTPIDLVEGAEAEGPYDQADINNVALEFRGLVQGRQKTALQILDRVNSFKKKFDRYHQGDGDARKEYFEALEHTAKFNPDWGSRVHDYMAFFFKARQLANPDQDFYHMRTNQGAETFLAAGDLRSAVSILNAQQQSVNIALPFQLTGENAVTYDTRPEFDGYTVQINPQRAPEKRSLVAAGREGECFLCSDNMPPMEAGIPLLNGDYTLFVNPSPFGKLHTVIVAKETTKEHPHQWMDSRSKTGIVFDVLDKMNTQNALAPFKIIFNSKGAGNSSDHFHLQGFDIDLPVEGAPIEVIDRGKRFNGVTTGFIQDFVTTAMVLESADKNKLSDALLTVTQKLQEGREGSPIAYDLLFVKLVGIDRYRVYIFPRTVEKPSQKSSDLISDKMGAPEMAGMFISFKGNKGQAMVKVGDDFVSLTRELLEKSIGAASFHDKAFLSKDILGVDQAMKTSPDKDLGGIDLSRSLHLQTNSNGQSIDIQIDAAVLEQLQQAQGLTPRILYIEPLKSMQGFLGILPFK